ncbi:MAG: 5-(carboxyamino)imidazole ribonucleotide synthase [Pseudanabaenaceae cyanobacterium SKYGB_i_bin29]|nr:5-(carboxyamino)imidazole ribonucleotide synthase [Pseudanabaenaceae cyanobacterium SKYG29]MDW8421731.1 5-(carboxyamino)imidazole ribonucleotide synthase [Pseudanabaenaceae cyanobacterium SKYGB_i_bin29]
MTTVGVIGAGQLAMMTAEAARSLSIPLAILPSSPTDPAIPVADYVAKDLADLAQRSSVITFENEFCSLEELRGFADRGVKFSPDLRCLAILVNKYEQRQFLRHYNLPTPLYALLDDYLQQPNPCFPAVAKLCRQGYDGKGTKIVNTKDELVSYWASTGNASIIVEPFIHFQQELAIMVARSLSGEISLFPVVTTQQIDQVCRFVIAPARISNNILSRINEIATTIVTSLNYVGILGIEFFLTDDQEILINEMAPRPHNSGHYTIEGCLTSQFSQLLRSILGMNLGATDMTAPVAVMVNLLGLDITDKQYKDRLQQIQQFPRAYLHWYHKQPRSGRKLGHVTILADSYDQALMTAAAVEHLWYAQTS